MTIITTIVARNPLEKNGLAQGKPFNITVIQVYALASNAEEAEVERFLEDLQNILELTPQKKSSSLQGTGMQK